MTLQARAPVRFIRAPALQASAALRPGRVPRSTRYVHPHWRAFGARSSYGTIFHQLSVRLSASPSWCTTSCQPTGVPVRLTQPEPWLPMPHLCCSDGRHCACFCRRLVQGDRYNLCLGILAACTLASCKHLPRSIPSFVRWQISAYTNWNLVFISLRVLLRQQQWEPFLLVNSVSIATAFRTAFAHGLDENMRKKFRELGLDVPRPLFVAMDHLVHTAPPIMLLASILKRKECIHPMNYIYVLILYTWFSFR